MALDLPGTTSLVLPPAFSLLMSDDPRGAFAHACAVAEGAAAGTLVWARRPDIIDVAVILSPDEPLATARRAVFAGLVALADALGAHAPPEVPVVFDWPAGIRFDGARIGGARLGWPDGCAEGEAPDWLVFSAMVIASKAEAGDPGLTPGSTSLENEGFALESPGALIEGFSRHLTKAFATWEEDGFAPVARRYLSRLQPLGGVARLEGNGDLSIEGPGGPARMALAPDLLAASWLDPQTGGPRL